MRLSAASSSSSSSASSLALLALSASSALAAIPNITDYTTAQISSGQAFQNVTDIANQNSQINLRNRPYNATCTWDTASVRREWRTLPAETRISFTDAVTCLQNLPPQLMLSSEASQYPGVKTRYDEYVATHINYTYNIHTTADFFSWHRYFVYQMEQDLRSLCGYTDAMPYWNWALDADAPQDSPLFAGDAASLGSNGEYIPDRNDTWLALQNVNYPPGTGGGCVQSGPFVNYTVNLGPLDLPNTDNVNSSFQYNPRCLVRDMNPWFSHRYNTYNNLTRSLLRNPDIKTFQWAMQGYNSKTDKFGCHGGGHWQTGGSMADFHSSPSDPLFYVHHAMVDNVWAIWQNLDLPNRQNAIWGSSQIGCDPPSCPSMHLTDELPFGFVSADPVFSDLMDTFSGPFCYRYE